MFKGRGLYSKRGAFHTSTKKLTHTRRSRISWVSTSREKRSSAFSSKFPAPAPVLKSSTLHYTAINPKGLVPAIEYKGRALYESLIICEFFEDAFPGYEPHVLPSDPFDRAIVRLWTDHVNKQIVPANMRLVQAQEPQKQREHLEELNKALRTLVEKVKGPYFLGEQFTLVDVALAPWVVRDWVIAEHRGYSREAVGAGWQAYAAQLESRESVLKTSSVRSSLSIYELLTNGGHRTKCTSLKSTLVTSAMRHRVKARRRSEPGVRGKRSGKDYNSQLVCTTCLVRAD